ncbi:unnamed protein product [marine sediment metagenome]|uniref:Uncharacterized protein n=1 Tax=marine sediment metagenome TaxID=412755 RepID=X0VBW6_9ZZZZ
MSEFRQREKYCPKVDRGIGFEIESTDAGKLKMKKCDGMIECGVASGPDFIWSECYFVQRKDKLRKVYEKPFREK